MDIRELEGYTSSYVSDELNIDDKTLIKLINKGIVKSEESMYKFDYVGLIIIDELVIKCYPKYTPDDAYIKSEFKNVLKTIKKYKFSHKDAKIYQDNIYYGLTLFEDVSFNKLSLMLFFIEDYFENGLYSNFNNVLEINGNGEIDWNRTVNDNFPIIYDNKPFYTEIKTKNKINDSYNYLRLLHECIISECSKHLEKIDLLDLFDLSPVKLSNKSIEDFGDKDFIINRLEKELNVEFNTQKQNLLKSMISYVANINDYSNENYLTFYGTRKYHIIWEEMCSYIFDNKLKLKYDSNKTLKSTIEKPKWKSNKGFSKYSEKTFIPDIVTFDKNHLIILDAKYYNLTFNKDELKGYPGIESISKQYFYELAYKNFVKNHEEFCGFKNAFLFPSFYEFENKGEVKLEFLSKWLQPIQIIMLPAKYVIESYLDNDKYKKNNLRDKTIKSLESSSEV